MRASIVFLLSILLSSLAPGWQIPAQSQQAVVGIAQDWNSSHATLAFYEKIQGKWTQIGKPWQARLGKSGLAWGRGIHPFTKAPFLKKEGDNRSPAGVYFIGTAFGIYPNINKLNTLSYTRITSRDLWVEDSNSPYYNRHLRINHEPTSPWEKKAQMKQNDYPHSLKLFIAHNCPTPQAKATPFAGSAIFFHIWRRNGAAATAGCTTMHESQLRWLISKINPAKAPIYILLPQSSYTALRQSWQLP